MAANRNLKVRIPVMVEIDVDAWANEYGTDDTAVEVRADVKRHVKNIVEQHLASLGLLAD